MTPKPIFASKTFWLNIIGLILAMLALPEFVGLIPEAYLPTIMAVQGALNIVVRFLTDSPVKLT